MEVFIGFDSREGTCFEVARRSLLRTCSLKDIKVRGVVLERLRKEGLYRRPTEINGGTLFDVISQHPMATEFAISRFFVPKMTKDPVAMFMDCDVLVRHDVAELKRLAEENAHIALWVVKHNHQPTATVKMDGQVQSAYARKNWSSVMVFNTRHPSHKRLTLNMLNDVPGRDLHRFCWLDDHEIGELSPQWNFLVGEQPQPFDPKIVHFTTGAPYLPGHENDPFADEWRQVMNRWAA